MNNSYIIDLAGVEDRTELHDRVEQGIPLPEWYGRNLDALYDVLTEPEFGGGCLICFIGCSEIGDGMTRYLSAMKHMCKAACEENHGLTIEFLE